MITEKEHSTLPISALFPINESNYEQKSYSMPMNPTNNPNLKCSTCNRCLQELFRQGCYLMFGDLRQQPPFNLSRLPNNINEGRLLEKLCLPDHPQIGTDGFCRICDTRVIQLKIEAARAIRNLKRQNQMSQIQTSHWQTLINRQLQCHPQNQSGIPPNFACPYRSQYFDKVSTDNIQQPKYPFEIIPCVQLKNNSYRININNHKYPQVDYSKPFHWAIKNNLASTEQIKMMNNNKSNLKVSSVTTNVQKDSIKEISESSTVVTKDTSVSSQSNLAAAASFFTKAGKKPITTGTESTSSFKRKKKIDHTKSKESEFMTCFSDILKVSPPPVPPTLLKTSLNRPLGCNTGKIKVIIRLKYLETSKPENHQNISPSQTCISVDSTKKQITVFESQSANSTPRRMNANIPKIYGFDAVYTDDDDPTELCSNALTDIIQSVVSGIDGCVFSFGHLRASSNLTMIGSDQQTRKLGLIPCAISWLFRLICEQKEKTGARFSVRVSAIEVHGKQEILKDLLSDIEVIENVGQCSPGVYLRDDPVSGTQLQNQSELRAPTAEKAAYYLDAALAARTMSFSEEDTRLSHFLFTLHVYQYRVERGTTGSAVAGGRSRLHMLDFGSGKILSQSDLSNKETTPTDSAKSDFPSSSTALSLSATAAVLLALVNGQRHIPYRTSKLSQLLREAMSSLSCRTCMVAHVAMNTTHCADSMQIIQFASKLQRLKRRKFSKLSGTSSDDSSSCDSFGFRRASRNRGGNAGFSSGSSTNGMTSSEADYTSSSEQSCDTVIYLGASRNKVGDEQSSFILRKRRISAPSFTNALPERSGSESDLLKLDISKNPSNAHQHSKASVRTNALVWPKVAAKNAIETLSTQKEMWVDGPMVSNKAKTQSPDLVGIPSKFITTETQTYSTEHNSIIDNNLKAKILLDAIQSNENNFQIPDINANIQESTNINTTSITSTNSTSNDNPSSQESTTAAVGSSDGDHKLIDPSTVPVNSHVITTGNVHSSNNNSSQLPSSTTHHIVSPQAYKPFVWDWVEKHSDMIVDTPILNNQLTPYPFQVEPMEEIQPPQKRSAKHCAKHQQLLKKSKPCINNEQIDTNEREGRKRHKSTKHKTAQTSMVIDNFKTTQFNNTGVEPNFTRVAEWVRSVSEETNRAQSLSPVRRNNTVKDSKMCLKNNNKDIIQPINCLQTTNYRSLDRHAQGFINMSQAGNYSNIYMESADLSHCSVQFSCVPTGSRTFDSIPLPTNTLYQQDILNINKPQHLPRHNTNKTDIENYSVNPLLKRVNSQNEDSLSGGNNQQRNQNSITNKINHTSSKHTNKNSPTRQTLERNSPNKTRSSSLIKTALFGRCKLSSSSNIDENNQYSVPNSPCKNKSNKNNIKQNIDFVPVNNTGGYHYVVMTSSLSTPAKQLQEETSKAIKRRSSSTSPGKSSGSSSEKKQMANAVRRDKVKEKNKEIKNDNNKIKIKKESKKKLSFLTSPLFGKKKEKEKFTISSPVKATKQQKSNPHTQLCNIHHGQENSSKVISPYCTVTQPKHSTHSSSGHGSDCSSVYGQQHKFSELAGHIKCRECTNIDEEGPCLNHIDQCNIDQHQLLRRSQRRGGGHTSSGYESIMRDSEVSSQNDSTSESSLGAAPRAQTPEKQQSQSSSSSSKQSRSAPNRSEETSEDTQSPVSVRKMSPKATHKTQFNDHSKRENEIKKIAKQIQFEKIYDLLAQQDMLKTELLQSKERILVDPTSWSYDLHVVEQMDPEDSSFIEALEKETDILRRRVEACKSHVLLITYFDIKYIHPALPEIKNHSIKVESNRKTTTESSKQIESCKQLKS